jgi:cytosine/adenosine deaminase-related metal-dependent hydrolase
MNKPIQRILVRAAALADATGLEFGPAAILVEATSAEPTESRNHQPNAFDRKPTMSGFQIQRIIATGEPVAIGVPESAKVLDFPDQLLIPSLVNAHVHLDLTHIGPQPRPAEMGFADWADGIRQNRATSDKAIAASVERGIELAIAGGTSILGDIAGGRSLMPFERLGASGLRGVSYFEVFGIGKRQCDAAEFIGSIDAAAPKDNQQVRFGFQPHAPYSCGLDVYRAAARTNRPIASHIAETLEELQFVDQGQGLLADLLKRIGVWDDTIQALHQHPLDLLEEILSATPVMAAHLNYIKDSHLDGLARWPVTVAYCPRASAYFGHPHGDWPGHRYREMLDRGVNVALGTDSIVCVPESNEPSQQLSVLGEMRFLHARDATDAQLLLKMGTMNGAQGLGFDTELVTMRNGPCAGILAIEVDRRDSRKPLEQALSNNKPPRWLM